MWNSSAWSYVEDARAWRTQRVLLPFLRHFPVRARNRNIPRRGKTRSYIIAASHRCIPVAKIPYRRYEENTQWLRKCAGAIDPALVIAVKHKYTRDYFPEDRLFSLLIHWQDMHGHPVVLTHSSSMTRTSFRLSDFVHSKKSNILGICKCSSNRR